MLLLQVDGGRSVWRAGARVGEAGTGKQPKFIALELPQDLVLQRSMVLPRMSAPNTEQAIRLEVLGNSPFPPQELVWGSRMREVAGGRKEADVAMASRLHVLEFVGSRWPEFAAEPLTPEVWVLTGHEQPIVFTGFGEGRRLKDAAMGRRWNWALVGLALILATLAALTPTMQLRMRALEAADAFQAVLRRVSPQVRKRDELATLNDRVRAVGQAASDRVDPPAVIDYLTQILPDDTSLYSLDVQKAKITVSGLTPNASAVLQKLSSDPRLKNVRSPNAVTRQQGATKEAFAIEFTLEPTQVKATGTVAVAAPGTAAAGAATGVSGVPAPAAAAVAAASSPGQPALQSLPAAAPTLKAAAPKAPAAGSSPFVIGGSR